MNEFKVIFTGCRNWTDEAMVHEVLFRIYSKHDNLKVIVGDCKTGVDRIVLEWCKSRCINHKVFCAEWIRHGKRAGPLRNSDMVNYGADMCVGFVSETSRGTLDCLSQAIQSGIDSVAYFKHLSKWLSGDGVKMAVYAKMLDNRNNRK